MTDGTAVVLGGTGGIGRAIVQAVAELFPRVVLTYLERADIAEDIAAASPVECVAMRADISSEADLDEVAAVALQPDGCVTAVVNAAGAYRSRSLADVDSDSWLSTARVHLLAPMLVAKAFRPALQAEGGGALVFVSSVAAVSPEPRGHDYVSAKGGLWALTRSLALDLAPSITVNSVAPGWVSSDRRPRSLESAGELTHQIPLRRYGSPADVASVVRLLATPGGYITGQTIVVDGGSSL